MSQKVRKFHCDRPYKGNIVDVRDYILGKVKKNKETLIITCEGLEGGMVIPYDQIDSKISRTSNEIQSRIYKGNTYRLCSFIYENNLKDEDSL